MTVQATPSFLDLVGDDVTLVFPFTFRVDDVSWLVVDFLDDFDTFTVNLDQENNPGGTVEYTVAPPSPGMGGPDPSFRVQRIVPANQNLAYTRYDPFDSKSHENALDKLTMILQDTVTYIDEADLILTDGLAQEIIDRTAADVILQNNIDAEAATRLGADNTLQANITAGDAAVTAAFIAADNVVIANQLVTDNAQDAAITANTLLITTGNSPGHTHVLADIIDYVPPVGTVPGGTADGELMYWDQTGGGFWALTSALTWDFVNAQLIIDASPGSSIAAINIINIEPSAAVIQMGGSLSASTNWAIWRSFDNGGANFWQCLDDHGLSAPNHRLSWEHNTVSGAFIELDASGELTLGGQQNQGSLQIQGIGGTLYMIALNNGNGGLYFEEQASAGAVSAGEGQIWAGTDQSLNFTDGLGVTTNLLAGGGGIAPGTVTDATLVWSGAAWVENTDIRAVQAGTTTLDIEGSGARVKLITTGAGVDEKRTRVRMDNFAGFIIDAETDGGFNSNFLLSANRTADVWQTLDIQTDVAITTSLLVGDGGTGGLVLELRDGDTTGATASALMQFSDQLGTNQGIIGTSAIADLFVVQSTAGQLSLVSGVGGTARLSIDALSLQLQEQSAPAADSASYGQFWILDSDGNRPIYTDGEGNQTFMALCGGSVNNNIELNSTHNFNTAGNYAANFIYYGADGGADTITLEDSGSQVNWPLYTAIQLIVPGSNTVTVTEGAGTTLFDDAGNDTVGGVTVSQGVVTIFRASATDYIIWGSGWT